MRLLAASLLALAVPGAAFAVPVVGVQQQAAAVDRLVAALLPDAGIADLAARSFDRGVEQGAGKDEELRELYRKHSGLKAAIAEPVRVALLKVLKRELPDLRDEVRAILQAELSAKEIGEASDFFTSPAGQRAYTAALKAIGENPGRTDQQQAEAASQAVMRGAKMEDYPALIAFGASSAAGKMNSRINPRVAAASRAWSDALIKANSAKIEKVAKRAAKKWVKAQGKRR